MSTKWRTDPPFQNVYIMTVTGTLEVAMLHFVTCYHKSLQCPRGMGVLFKGTYSINGGKCDYRSTLAGEIMKKKKVYIQYQF